jgi:hypothetical protein
MEHYQADAGSGHEDQRLRSIRNLLCSDCFEDAERLLEKSDGLPCILKQSLYGFSVGFFTTDKFNPLARRI